MNHDDFGNNEVNFNLPNIFVYDLTLAPEPESGLLPGRFEHAYLGVVVHNSQKYYTVLNNPKSY